MPIKHVESFPRSKEWKLESEIPEPTFLTSISGDSDILSLRIIVVDPLFQPNGAESQRTYLKWNS